MNVSTLLGIGFALFVAYAIWHGVYLVKYYKDGGALLSKRVNPYTQ